MNNDLSALQERLGYMFRSRDLLKTALTHSSYANEHSVDSNERLEFLGDSVLNFIVTRKIFSQREMNEGELTCLRAKIVSRQPLSSAVKKLGVLEFLRLGEGAKKEHDLSEKFKSDLFEALVGAIYLDSGSLECCEKFVFRNIDITAADAKDHKSELQILVQDKKLGEIKYVTALGEDGRSFVSEVSVGGKCIGSGSGRRKQSAEKEAAAKAVEFLTRKAEIC